jgi:dCMP deaminase
MTKTERYQQMFMKTALISAEQSFAKRNKVGAVLVKDNRIVVNAWNGRVSGVDNCCEDGDITRTDVVHAEMNAISFAARNGICTKGCELYITLSPCPTCALLLIQSGIKAVYYIDEYRITDGIDLLKRSKINIKQLKGICK